MISKQTLKDFEFKTIGDYFNYIVDSYLNGNFSQTKELFSRLSKEQKADFFKYIVNIDVDLRNKLFLYLCEVAQ